MLLLLLVASSAWAQDDQVRVRIEPARILPGDAIQYIIEAPSVFAMQSSPRATGEAISPNAESSHTSTQTTFVNGIASSVYQRVHVFRARREGPFQIGPVTVVLGTRQVEVPVVYGKVESMPNLTRAGLPGTPGRPLLQDRARADALAQYLFTTIEVSNESPFVGEPFEAITYLYIESSQDALRSDVTREPSNPRFLTLPNPPDMSRQLPVERLVLDGRTFQRRQMHRTILVPTQSGTLTVAGAEVGIGRDRGMFVISSPIGFSPPLREIAVRPLPDPPEGIVAQLVGNYTIGATLDRAEVEEGELVSLTVRLSGEGYLESVGLTNLPDIPGLSLVSTEVTHRPNLSSGKLVSTKGFKLVYQAMDDGAVAIPALAFALVDPATGRQRVERTDALTLVVRPSTRSSLQLTQAAEAPLVRGQARELSRQGILYIDEGPMTSRTLEHAREPLAHRPLYWLMHGLLLLAVALFGVWTSWRRHLEGDPERLAARLARRRGAHALRTAQGMLAGAPAAEFYAALADGVLGHVSSVLGRPAAGLTAEEAARALRARGLGEQAERLTGMLERFDAMRYAPSAADTDRAEDLRRAQQFVADLSREQPPPRGGNR
jgi:hypothetical protein